MTRAQMIRKIVDEEVDRITQLVNNGEYQDVYENVEGYLGIGDWTDEQIKTAYETLR